MKKYRYKQNKYYIEIQSREWWFPFYLFEKYVSTEEEAINYIEVMKKDWTYL